MLPFRPGYFLMRSSWFYFNGLFSCRVGLSSLWQGRLSHTSRHAKVKEAELPYPWPSFFFYQAGLEPAVVSCFVLESDLNFLFKMITLRLSQDYDLYFILEGRDHFVMLQLHTAVCLLLPLSWMSTSGISYSRHLINTVIVNIVWWQWQQQQL